MTETDKTPGVPAETRFDVVIVGGGLAGLTLARQLRRSLPGWTVAVVERHRRPLPEAAWKVGESSVEVGSNYFEGLGLSEYMLQRQLVKFGLRFFPGGGHLPIEQRTEIGPSQEPVVKSYQLDRGRFESDLREMNEADGVVLFEGCRVDGVQLSEGDSAHRVSVSRLPADESQRGAESFALESRWVVDASGRQGLLRKSLQLSGPSGHVAHSGWFRVAGRVDINDWVRSPNGSKPWDKEDWSPERWRSTNHLMGPGYWCWIIPLASGNTSIGVVVHEEQFPFTHINTLERCRAFLAENEPQLFEAVRERETLDFRCLRGYSHGCAAFWSPQRYAMVGEAGAFVDPLYSPGSDFIAFANSFTVELMLADEVGSDLVEPAATFNLRYQALVQRALDLYRTAGPIYGHGRAMAAKVYFDNFAYWAFFAQYWFQRIYAEFGPAHDKFIALGIELATLSQRMQALLRAWAENTSNSGPPEFVGMPRFPSLLVDVYMDLRQRRTTEEATALLALRVSQAREIAAELAFRVLLAAGPELGYRLLAGENAGKRSPDELLQDWAIGETRFLVEFLPSLERRKRLSGAVRDVERSLGKIPRHPAWQAMFANPAHGAIATAGVR